MSTTVTSVINESIVIYNWITSTPPTTTTEEPYYVIDEDKKIELYPNIALYGVNILVGGLCMIAVIMSFVVLMSSKKFRQQYSVIIVLCVAEVFAELGIILEATTRRELFTKAIETGKSAQMSSRDCLQPWVISQLIGDFWCPSLEFLMGLERMCAVSFPTVFRTIFTPYGDRFIVLATLIAAAFVITPTTITIIWYTENVRWSCGRKAAYGANFGLVDYTYNVIGFTAAFLFNIVAMCKAIKIKQSGRNMAKLKCYTAIAFLSTLLISIPNMLSIINVFVTVPNELMTPAPILACANGAVQFLVYFTFNPEFRHRFLQIITFNQIEKVITVKPVSNFTQAPTMSTSKMTLVTVSKVALTSVSKNK
uniref:7TM_GPCR_Srx domain-containing protein n=1 Tax=Panagrellus redivivus TaxID=6233 RepID=A0A7E4VTH1_PANRE